MAGSQAAQGQFSRPPSQVVRQVRLLLASSHPEPAAAVTALSCALAASAGRPAWGVVAVGAAVAAGQLSVGWCNDYVDRDRDALTGRRDKPVGRGDLAPAVAARAAFVALAAVPLLSLLSGWRATLVHCLAVTLAWGYDLRLKSTAFSVVPYAIAFGMLPVFVALGLPGAPWPPWWAPLAGALLGAGAHFANTLPDLADDLATGVRGLPHRLGESRSRVASAVLLLAATAVLGFAPGLPSSTSALWLLLIALGAAATFVIIGAACGRRPVPALHFGQLSWWPYWMWRFSLLEDGRWRELRLRWATFSGLRFSATNLSVLSRGPRL